MVKSLYKLKSGLKLINITKKTVDYVLYPIGDIPIIYFMTILEINIMKVKICSCEHCKDFTRVSTYSAVA